MEGEGRPNREGRERKSMDGTVTRLVSKEGRKSKVFVRPDEGDPIAFKFKPEEIRVELNGEEAVPEDIETGQRAGVRYVTVVAPKKDVEQNIARSISLETASGGDEAG